MNRAVLALLAVLACDAEGWPPLDGPPGEGAAADLLGRVSAQMGVPALEKAGFTQWTFAGTYDESVERGGFEPEPPAGVRDTFAVDLERNGAGWDSEGRRGDGTVRWRRFLYPSPDVLLRVDVPSRWAAASRSEAYRPEQLRAARAIPQALLREMASREDAVRLRPALQRDGARLSHLEYATAAGDVLDVLVDSAERVRRVEVALSVPFVGERRVAWDFADWTRDRGVSIPRRLTILMGDEPLRVLALESVVWDRARSIFVLPDGVATPKERPGPASLPRAPLAPTARLIADDVWLAPDVRPGINGYFIRQPDGITAFETPAGFLYPQIEIPPPNLARGRKSSEPAEAFVDLIHRTIPGEPIRRVVISHAHADHAGGVRAFAAEAAEIVVPRGAAAPVRRFLDERFELAPDRYEQSRARLRPVVREVDGRETLGTGATRLEVLTVGENPHSAAMAVLWLPRQRILLQGDLFYAEPLEEFPSAARVPIMKWFAGWLERQDLEPAVIYGTHSDLPGTREHLEKLKTSAG
jgi:glyoxylase-like metal-dependent hydrolase (beta-lactamase superfamily II)